MDDQLPIVDVTRSTTVPVDTQLEKRETDCTVFDASCDPCDLLELADLLSVLDHCHLADCDPGCHI